MKKPTSERPLRSPLWLCVWCVERETSKCAHASSMAYLDYVNAGVSTKRNLERFNICKG